MESEQNIASRVGKTQVKQKDNTTYGDATWNRFLVPVLVSSGWPYAIWPRATSCERKNVTLSKRTLCPQVWLLFLPLGNQNCW